MSEVNHSLAAYDINSIVTHEDCTENTLPSPLYHELNEVDNEEELEEEIVFRDQTCLRSKDKVFDYLLSNSEILIENTLNNKNLCSVFDGWSDTLDSKTQAPFVIPVLESDLCEELESVATYRPPSPQYIARPVSPEEEAPENVPLPPPSPPPREAPLRCGPPISKPLTVTCNEEEGIFHPSLLCRGSRGKCIHYQGEWLTPNQFEYHTGRAQSKYWKRSIYALGTPLVNLMREGRMAEHDRSCTCGEMERRDQPKQFHGVS